MSFRWERVSVGPEVVSSCLEQRSERTDWTGNAGSPMRALITEFRCPYEIPVSESEVELAKSLTMDSRSKFWMSSGPKPTLQCHERENRHLDRVSFVDMVEYLTVLVYLERDGYGANCHKLIGSALDAICEILSETDKNGTTTIPVSEVISRMEYYRGRPSMEKICHLVFDVWRECEKAVIGNDPSLQTIQPDLFSWVAA